MMSSGRLPKLALSSAATLRAGRLARLLGRLAEHVGEAGDGDARHDEDDVGADSRRVEQHRERRQCADGAMATTTRRLNPAPEAPTVAVTPGSTRHRGNVSCARAHPGHERRRRRRLRACTSSRGPRARSATSASWRRPRTRPPWLARDQPAHDRSWWTRSSCLAAAPPTPSRARRPTACASRCSGSHRAARDRRLRRQRGRQPGRRRRPTRARSRRPSRASSRASRRSPSRSASVGADALAAVATLRLHRRVRVRGGPRRARRRARAAARNAAQRQRAGRAAGTVRGVRVTRLGRRIYRTHARARLETASGRRHYRLYDDEPGYHDEDGTDFAAVASGCISVTPIALRPRRRARGHRAARRAGGSSELS